MKKILAVIAATFFTTSTMAGSLAYVAPEVMMIEEPASMGGSGAWLIPLIILAILGLSLSGYKKPLPCLDVCPVE